MGRWVDGSKRMHILKKCTRKVKTCYPSNSKVRDSSSAASLSLCRIDVFLNNCLFDRPRIEFHCFHLICLLASEGGRKIL